MESWWDLTIWDVQIFQSALLFFQVLVYRCMGNHSVNVDSETDKQGENPMGLCRCLYHSMEYTYLVI